MDRVFYPAIFHTADEGGYWVSFPDLPECLTEGDTMQEAYEMAVDALGLALIGRKDGEIPKASEPGQLKAEPGAIPILIEFSWADYHRKHSTKAVKKTLSIPEWMNEECMKRGINFSQALQEALLHKLQTKDMK